MQSQTLLRCRRPRRLVLVPNIVRMYHHQSGGSRWLEEYLCSTRYCTIISISLSLERDTDHNLLPETPPFGENYFPPKTKYISLYCCM
jgi:hypothetical protein